ncbi:MAG: hypothetical protein M3169_10520 [Candidatus Eremiobacteraeota bacterium]|nr:hypothetical protein [Candidatus Eremiobacteraeota bacterium]
MRALLLVSMMVLAGCGGGGASVAGTQQPALMQNTPVSGAGATLTLVIPRAAPPSSAGRAPRFVSPNAASIVITVLSVNGAPPSAAQVPPSQNPETVALSTGSGGNCTTGPNGETCTVPIPAPTGNVTYQFDLFDAAGHKLATNTLTFTVLPGVGNQNFSAVLKGIVVSVVVTAPTLNPGTSFSGPITVQTFDASGALIVGSAPYANPFTLTDNDASGHTSLTDNGVTGPTVTANGPNDVVLLNYDGTAITSFTITVKVPGQNPAVAGTVTVNQNNPLSFTGTVPDDTAHGGLPSDPNYNQDTLFFVQIGQTRSFTANQAGWSNFSLVLDPASCGTGANAVVTFTSADNKTFAVTSQKTGICKGTVSGGPAGSPMSRIIWFSVGSSNFVVH